MGVCGVDVIDERAVLTFGGIVSVLSYACVFFLFYYLNIPNLRRHPTTIAIRKCWFELLFVSQYLWLAFPSNSFFWSSYTENFDDDQLPSCQANPNIWPLAWLTQFSLLGGELWFAVLSVDIHMSLTNPFASYASNDKMYLLGVFGMAMLTATILVSVTPIQYGLSTDPMIWVKDSHSTINAMKIGMFYIYMPLIYFYCGVIAVWSRWQISRGLEDTLRMRKYSVSKQTRCTWLELVCIYIYKSTPVLNLTPIVFRRHWLFPLLDLRLCHAVLVVFEIKFSSSY
jgi:hypothetical protein